MGKEEAVPAAQRTQKRPKVRPANQRTSSKRTALLPLPDDVKVFVISGMQGSGVESFIRQATQSLKDCGAAVMRIDTDLLVGTRSDECDICKQCALIRTSIRKVHRCTMCPEALNVDWLNAAINREAADIRHSAAFVQGAQKGIITLEGAYVLAVQDYHDIAVNSRWWLSSLNTARCKKEYLQKRRLWKQHYSKTESVYLAEVEKENNQRLWRSFFHEERWAESMSSYVDADHIVDLDFDYGAKRPTQGSIYESFNAKMRREAGVRLPPLVCDASGTCVGDAVDVGATSASAGSATKPARKHRWQEKKPAGRGGFGVSWTIASRHRGKPGFGVSWTCARSGFRQTMRFNGCTTDTGFGVSWPFIYIFTTRRGTRTSCGSRIATFGVSWGAFRPCTMAAGWVQTPKPSHRSRATEGREVPPQRR